MKPVELAWLALLPRLSGWWRLLNGELQVANERTRVFVRADASLRVEGRGLPVVLINGEAARPC